jgi:hypothetical protein
LGESRCDRKYGHEDNQDVFSHYSAPVSGFAPRRDVLLKKKKAAAMFP